MSWIDRLREAAYTSPSGSRVLFTYEDVSKAFDKKTTGFNFPDADGTYVQDLGHSGRRYPLRLFFWGENYDQEAAAFDLAIRERGTGKLEHPVYGSVNVVPFGLVRQRDDLKTAANQAVVEVTFWETIALIYPTAQTDPGFATLAAVSEYNATGAEEFGSVLVLDKAVDRARFENTYRALLGAVTDTLQPIADAQDDVRQQFDTISRSLDIGLDSLISDPSTLALQTVLLIQSPARAATEIGARLSVYQSLISAVLDQENAIAELSNDASETNRFHTNDLYVSTFVTGSIVSVVNTQFITKAEALTAAEGILAQFEAVTVWRDANFEALQELDTGGAYQQLQEAVAIAAGFLVEISFSLKQERRVVLDRNRTIIDLASEFYGTVDDQLDFLITSNNLSGSEILELQEGREIGYYV